MMPECFVDLSERLTLLPYQQGFVEQFIMRKEAKVQLLIGPPGSGKTRAVGGVIAQTLASSKPCRVLLIVPVSQAAQLQVWLSSASLTKINWMRTRDFREAEAVASNGESLWSGAGIYGMTTLTASQQRIRESLLNQDWDLLVLNDAIELGRTHDLGGRKKSGIGRVHKTLLLSSNPEARALLTSFKILPITEWKAKTTHDATIAQLGVSDFLDSFYTPADKEIEFRSKLQAFADEAGHHPRASFVRQQLFSRAISSPLAIETALRSLKSGLSAKDSGLAWLRATVGLMDTDAALFNWSLPEPTDEPLFQEELWEDKVEAQRTIDRLLEVLDEIYIDPKLAALLKILTDSNLRDGSMGKPTCILTSFSVTASYLRSALSETFSGVQSLTSNSAFTDVVTTLDRFRSSGGLLVATSSALQGLDLSSAVQLIHYDAGSSEETILRRSRSPDSTNIRLRDSRFEEVR